MGREFTMSAPADVMVDVFAGLSGTGGITRYVRDVVAALTGCEGAPPARFAHPRNVGAQARALVPAGRLHALPLPWPALRTLYAIATRVPLKFDGWFDRAAVVHSPVGYGPTFARTRLIANVHDLTPLEHPEWYPVRARLFMSRAIPHAARHADVVLTHSAFVAARVTAVLGVPPARIDTLPPPLSRGFAPVPRDEARAHVRRRYGLDGPFVLHVGTLEPRKNHVTLIAAFETLRKAGFPGALVLAGREGWKYAPILGRIQASPERHAIHHVRDAGDRDLVALYGAATACAYPSLEEGFGMPLLESMVCGAACVTSDHPALTELAGDDALAVPARDAGALAEALIRLWRDEALRDSLSAAARTRAAAYTFERWAPRLFALYRRELAAA
jgi:glycosyltransferase involved in cell wall biosynthesis